jgi:hypothetical protein
LDDVPESGILLRALSRNYKTVANSLTNDESSFDCFLLTGTAGFCCQVNGEGRVSALMLATGVIIFAALMSFLVGRLLNSKSN